MQPERTPFSPQRKKKRKRKTQTVHPTRVNTKEFQLWRTDGGGPSLRGDHVNDRKKGETLKEA